MAYADRGIRLCGREVEERLNNGEKISFPVNLTAVRLKIANVIEECGFKLCDGRNLSAAYFGEEHAVGRVGSVHAVALQTQYIEFVIPGSRIRPLQIRVSDHAGAATNRSDLDTYKLGVDGVIRVLKELAGGVRKYERVYAKWGDMRDILNNGVKGLAA
jgi:hypothetical protein